MIKLQKKMPNFLINYSPNFSTIRRNSKSIKFIVIHYTGMNSEIKAINRLTDVNSKVSCHYFIKNNGQIILMVPENFIAWHAGKSYWSGHKFLNKFSIGIEIQNAGHENQYRSFNKKQIDSIVKLCSYLKKKYKIKKKNIIGHSDISYERKNDPGEKFPWKLLSDKKLTIWHNVNKTKLKKLTKLKVSKTEKVEFIKNLKKIGYEVVSKFKFSNKLIVAFQRRFRQNLIDGIIDKECLILSRNLSKK